MPGYYKFDHNSIADMKTNGNVHAGVLTFSHQSHQGCALPR